MNDPVWLPPEKTEGPAWTKAFLTTARRRHYSYRTEPSYLVWIERFARHVKRTDLEALAENEIAAFPDELAPDVNVSVPTFDNSVQSFRGRVTFLSANSSAKVHLTPRPVAERPWPIWIRNV